ncbi:MAG: hypothetical protein K6B70_04325 [Clostridia bacterium]|nr:hypothetical protein [Clostridia bacterium]
MTKQEIVELVNSGREIEFVYDQKKYSITYGVIDGVKVISFCEFYKKSTEVKTVNELLEIKRNGVSVEEMLLSITNDNIYIF